MKFDGIDTQGYIYNQRDLRSTNTPYNGRLIHDDQRMFFGDGVQWVELVTNQWAPTITLYGDVSGSGPIVNMAAANINTSVSPTVGKYGTIPQGTIMLFGQASAPTGWTKLTSWQDTAQIIVNSDADGTSLATGGTVAPTITHTHSVSVGATTGYAGAHNHSMHFRTVSVGSGTHSISYGTGLSSAPNHYHGLVVDQASGNSPIPYYQEVIAATYN